jgi:hypothetical protein
MKIGNASNRPISPTYGTVGQAASGARAVGSAATLSSSDQARLSRLSLSLSSNSPERQAKLSKLEAAVTDGTYAPAANDVSASILRYSVGLFGSRAA